MTWTTQHDLPEPLREKMISLLNLHVADARHLALQTKHAHWNVKGPHFASLHALFDELVEIVDDETDDLAERAVQLGGIADGTLAGVSSATRLPPYPADLLAGRDHLTTLAGNFRLFARSLRAAIDLAAAAGDADTADVFTQVSRAIDKAAWQLEAHLVTSAG